MQENVLCSDPDQDVGETAGLDSDQDVGETVGLDSHQDVGKIPDPNHDTKRTLLYHVH